MKSKEAVERMREIEKALEKWEDAMFGKDFNNNSNVKIYKKESKEIYEKFKDGCREDVDCYGYPNFEGGWECGQQYLNKEIIFCPNCKEIKEIWDRIRDVQIAKGDKK